MRPSVALWVTPFLPLQGDRWPLPPRAGAPGRRPDLCCPLPLLLQAPCALGVARALALPGRFRSCRAQLGSRSFWFEQEIAMRDPRVNRESLLPHRGVHAVAVTFLRAARPRGAGCAPSPRRGRAGCDGVRAAAPRRVPPPAGSASACRPSGPHGHPERRDDHGAVRGRCPPGLVSPPAAASPGCDLDWG